MCCPEKQGDDKHPGTRPLIEKVSFDGRKTRAPEC